MEHVEDKHMMRINSIKTNMESIIIPQYNIQNTSRYQPLHAQISIWYVVINCFRFQYSAQNMDYHVF